MGPIPPRRFQFTIRQLLKLVLGAGLFCAYLTPLARGELASHSELTTIHLLSLPMIAGVLVLVLARRSPSKHWLLILLFLPYAAGTTALCGLAVGVNFTLFVGGEGDPRALILVLLLGLFFVWVSIWMIRQLIPRQCPGCWRWALLTDPATDPDRFRICVSCGRRCRRDRDGPWALIDGPAR